jgi:spermidine/putrescine transport system permease protein
MTDLHKVQFGEQLSPRQELGRSAVTSGPAIAWVTLFLLLPLLAVVGMSFLSRGAYGQVQWHFTLNSFKRFLGFGVFGFEPLYPMVIVRSLVLAAGTVGICGLAAVPLAFFISGLPGRWKSAALMLVVIPFWTNLLIRTYAWQLVLSGTGWVSRIAASLHLIAPGQALFPGTLAVFIGMTCDFLPFLVLPLYASVEKIDWSIAEAASDLGANGPRVFWHALLPQIMPGLVAGIILVFVPATGQFVIPDLLGGAKLLMLGNAIQQQFGSSRDWPFGSVIACFAMGIVMLALWIYARVAGERGRETLL